VEDIRGVGQNLIDHPTYTLSYTAPPGTQAAELRAFQTALTLRSAWARADQDLHIAPISTCPISLEVSPTGTYFRLLTSVVKPQSCGQVHLRAADPAAPPHIDLGYFTHPDDMPRLIEAVRVARRLAQLSPLADLVIQELVPGPQVGGTDTALETASAAWLKEHG
jgi:choline dehydrogenase